MKKRKSANINDEGESMSSKLLFNKTENLVKKLKRDGINNNLDSTDCQPAWVDEDDCQFESSDTPNNVMNIKLNKITLNKDKLKQKYETLMGTPGWAQLNKNKSEDYDGTNDDILRTVGHLRQKKSNGLKNEYLDIKPLAKINKSTRNEGTKLSCVEFHSKASVALVAGSSGVVTLFSIGGESNKLHNFKLTGWKDISTANILPDGSEAYLSSSKSHKFCVYNLMKGEPKLVDLPTRVKEPSVFKLSNDGKYIAICEDDCDNVFLLRTGSYELLRCLKHNDNVMSVTFSHDDKELYTIGCTGEVTVWDLSTYRPVKKFNDNGCVRASLISSSVCGRLLAMGSMEGIVNIYDTSELTTREPVPLKTISNLRTAITHLKFNPTTEILSIASDKYPNAVKMVHIPSYHVFKNFPEHNFDLNNVLTVNFSPNSGYMGLGTDQGFAYLYRMKHYKNY